MKRLWLLLALACTSTMAEEIVLVVPRLAKGRVAAAEGDVLHAQYDAAWANYDEAIAKVVAEVIQALDGEFNKAADAGSLESADMWDKKKKGFAETKTVTWSFTGKPKAEVRKKPKAEAPTNFGEVLQLVQQETDNAVSALKSDYEALVREYTKARNLERAKQLQGEIPRHLTSLTQLEPQRQEVLHGWIGVNRLPKTWKHPCKVVVGGHECPVYVFAHAPSRLVYDLPAGSRRFTATGVCPKGIPPNGDPQRAGNWQYKIEIDGQEVFREHLGQQELQIAVDIPPGAKRLELIGDGGLRPDWDCVVWAFPTIETE